MEERGVKERERDETNIYSCFVIKNTFLSVYPVFFPDFGPPESCPNMPMFQV